MQLSLKTNATFSFFLLRINATFVENKCNSLIFLLQQKLALLITLITARFFNFCDFFICSCNMCTCGLSSSPIACPHHLCYADVYCVSGFFVVLFFAQKKKIQIQTWMLKTKFVSNHNAKQLQNSLGTASPNVNSKKWSISWWTPNQKMA